MKTKYLAFAVAAIMLASCSNKEDFAPQDELKDTPITIASAGVVELANRAVTSEGFLVGSEEAPVSMSVWITGSSERYCADNMLWSHDGDSWSCNSIALYDAQGPQQICALYPYTENDSAEGMTITADGITDYLVAESETLTSSTVELTLTHALSKLVLNPTFGDELEGETIANVEVQNMYESGTLNITDNTWSACEGSTALTMTDNEVVVIPMENCQSFPIKITMDSGCVFKSTISLAGVDKKLEPGTQYNIALQIGNDRVIVDDITAASWGTPVDGGGLETE